MGGRTILLATLFFALSACEKDFDEKYESNLEKLEAEAREIETSVDQQLAEGREADKITESADQTDSEKAR